MCIGVLTPIKNTTTLFFAKPPPLNLQIVQTPFLGNPPIYWFFITPPPLKLGFFREPAKY